MKLFVYLLLCLLILSIGSLFVLKSPKGEPWLTISDFYNTQSITQKAINLKSRIVNKIQSITKSDSEPAIYKWQDEQGIWHYSDNNNAKVKAWVKPENLTIIPAIKSHHNNIDEAVKSNIINNALTPDASRVENIKSLIEDSHNIQKIMNERTQHIDNQLK